MSNCRSVEKSGEERGQSSTTGSEAEQTLVGDAFLDLSKLPEYATTEPCITHPLEDLNDPQLTPPVHTHALSRNPTPRPHLFQSLEAARDHVYRKSSDTRQAPRNASGEVSQASSEDEPSLQDMNPLPSICAFGRSLTSHARPQSPALPGLPSSPIRDFARITKPIFWENVPKPLNTSSSRNVSSSQMSGSSVDNIIGRYGQLSSSAAQSQAAVYGGSSSIDEVDFFIGQIQDDAQLSVDTEPCGRDAATLARGGLDFRLTNKVFEQSTPPGPPTSRAPLHPSNPFFNGSCPDVTDNNVAEPWPKLCLAGPDALLRVTSTPPIDESQAKFGSDLVAGSLTGSETVSIAESKVGPLNRPSNAMHSVRRQRRGRRSSVNDKTRSAGVASEGTDASDADEDPFKYDRRGAFLQPSKERVVSAHLRQVSGLPRESTATVYSQDGTPSRSFYGENAIDYFDKDGQPLPPGPDRLRFDLAAMTEPSRNPFTVLQRGQHNSANVTKGFYDPNAINPDWASGEPDIVRVPVTKKGNLFGGPRWNSGLNAKGKPEQQMGLAALRRREGDNRITGNTED